MTVAALSNDKSFNLPKPVWIALVVLGFIAFWPIGLAILAYLWWSGKLGSMMNCSKRDFSQVKRWHGRTQGTGNAAFDEYREETMRRLDEEAEEFRMFRERLRRAKDQREFDQFMSERNGYRAEPGPAPQNRSGDRPESRVD